MIDQMMTICLGRKRGVWERIEQVLITLFKQKWGEYELQSVITITFHLKFR